MKKLSEQPESCEQLLRAAHRLGVAAGQLKFSAPVSHVYNPLAYAWEPHELYLRRFGAAPKQVVFLGMNPGPFGMVQTGIPFGEIQAVRDWLRIGAPVGQPVHPHPRRPVTGFGCVRSEVSGKRLWGLFAERFGSPTRFFASHLVVNYCPLAFVVSSGRNYTPDKLLPEERSKLFAICDEHLRAVVRALRPEWLIAIGDFAAKRLAQVFERPTFRTGQILHPSPACPAANRDWAGTVTRQLCDFGVWR